MADPRWNTNKAAPLLRIREPGVTDGADNRNLQTETNRRLKDDIVTVQGAVQAAAQQPVAAGPAPTPPPVVAPLDLRFHKWAHYVTVAKPHPSGEDPVIDPAFAHTIAEGYAKAHAIATRDNARALLIIIGGGGPYKESINWSSPLVDVIGWGQPTIEGNGVLEPLGPFFMEGVTCHSPNEGPALQLLPMPGGRVDLSPDAGVRFSKCSFYGQQIALYAQRPYYAEDCMIWQEPQADGTFAGYWLEVAPLTVEMDSPQSWWSVMRGCRIYSGLLQGPPQGELNPVEAKGWAVKIQSGIGGAPVSNLISYDGVFRTNAGTGGFGAIQSGLLLDDCYVYGSARVRDWTLAHRHGAQYGGFSIPERSGSAYALVSGHDWIDGAGNFNGRQYGIVLFDGCNTHATVIVVALRDPNTVSSLFTGGVAAFYRNSLHLARYDGVAAAAMRSNGATAFYVKTVMSATSCAAWASGATGAADAGSQTSVSTVDSLLWHPYYA